MAIAAVRKVQIVVVGPWERGPAEKTGRRAKPYLLEEERVEEGRGQADSTRKVSKKAEES